MKLIPLGATDVPVCEGDACDIPGAAAAVSAAATTPEESTGR